MQKELLIQYWRENYNFKEKEIEAFKVVKRENFVLKELEYAAYEDTPLPILREKTISQPTTVMIMTSALELIEFSRKNLKRSEINNIEIHEMDGSKGIEKEAPYDKIIITAACKDFPHSLIEQLRPHGVIVAPVGNEENQMMVKAVKKENNDLEYEFLGPFLFSPLYGDYGFEI